MQNASCIKDTFYQQVWDIFPHLPNLIQEWKDKSFNELAELYQSKTTPTELIKKILSKQVRDTLGNELAEALVRRLEKNSAVIAANYHSIECFAELVQDIHFFALNELRAKQSEINVIPILACSTVALNSQTYPCGLMLSRRAKNNDYVHLPFFPLSQKKMMISQVPKINRLQLENALYSWKKLHLKSWEYKAATGLVEEHILKQDIFELNSIGEQVSYINHKICRSRYPESLNTHVIYIDAEHTATELLLVDLQNPDSILSQVLFQTQVRTKVLHSLAGVKSCWSKNLIYNEADLLQKEFGTVFFWAMDNGRRFPLRLIQNAHGFVLENGTYSLPLNADAVLEALRYGKIIPGLFMVHTTLILEHHLTCFGGIFMSHYLPLMLSAVVEALELDFKSYNALLALPMTVALAGEASPRLAGTVEFFAAGGLKQRDLEMIGKLTIDDVLPASLREWYYDYVPKLKRQNNWQLKIEKDSYDWKGILLENNMV